MNKEKKETLVDALKEIKKQIKMVINEAWIDADTCFNEKPDFVVCHKHMRLLHKIAEGGN